MRREKLDQKMVTKMILEEVKNKNIPLAIEPPKFKDIEIPKKEKFYEPAPVSVFDAFTLILFTLNLIKMTDINWFLVFLPMAFPYIIIGITWCISKLIIKIEKNKKSNLENKSNEVKVN
jgi:hypothetical protein